MDDRIHLAFDMSFAHTEGRWRLPRSWQGYGYYPDPSTYEDVARIAERGLLDMVFFGDGTGIPDTWQGSLEGAVRWGIQWPRHDKSPLVAMMSRVTRHVGFCVTFASTYMHPYYIARLANSLDHLTGGRIALNLITSTRLADAANYGYDALMEHGQRYERMEEFVAVCTALWDSVQPDAIVMDPDTGVFADPDKVAPINHHGRFFDVRGPLNCLPSPQQRPVLIQAGASPRGIAASATFAEMVFASGNNPERMVQHRQMLDHELHARGRNPDHVGILWGTRMIVGETEQEARRKARALVEVTTPEAGGVYMAHNSGFDFASLPEKFTLGEAAEMIEQAQASPSGWIHQRLAEEGPDTVVELDEVMETGRQSIGAGPSAIVGTPTQVCDRLEELHELTGRRGGFMVTSPDFLPGSLTDIVELVVPELQRRGLYRTAYEGTTLRESFHGSAAPLG